MANLVTFTLDPVYSGTDANNFTIVGVHTNGSPANTTIATNVTKTTLSAGTQYSIAETITGGTVCSTGVCTNCVNWEIIASTPTPTSTPTSTSTAIIYTYYLTNYLSKSDTDSSGNPDYFDFCVAPGQTTGTAVYSTISVIDLLLNVTLYTNNTLTTAFTSLGTDGYYAVAASSGVNTFTAGPTGYRLLEINNSGYITDLLTQDCSGGGGGGAPI